MMQWTVADIVTTTGGRLLYGANDLCFSCVGIDSRRVDAGMLFVAICGQVHDGHTFIEQVVASGVRGMVIQSDRAVALDHDAWTAMGVACVAVNDTTVALGALAACQRRRVRIPVVAITGSSGKTTTRQMTTRVMAQRYNTLATQGNLNNEIGVPLTLFNLAAEHQAAVVELGMNHAGEIDRLGAICKPTIGVITNVGPAHLEFLGSVAGVARAKAELLAHISPEGSAVLNLDDPHVAALADTASGRVFFFGTAAPADVRAEAIQEGARRIAFDLCLPGETVAVQLPASGRFMVSNALAAAAVGHLAGLTAQEIKAGLEAFVPVAGRFSIKKLANGVHLIDDTYNANPDSMAAALDALGVLKGTQRAFVALGDMLELGGRAEPLHQQVGQLAARAKVSKLYAHGTYAHSVVAGARAQGMIPAQLYVGSKTEIATDLIQDLQPGDWVLVKGSRGMAMETVVAAICRWAENE
jgi:UDP-N-acetylmuramoyl-tripeptide--D-alanyl-D-alanine ligase